MAEETRTRFRRRLISTCGLARWRKGDSIRSGVAGLLRGKQSVLDEYSSCVLYVHSPGKRTTRKQRKRRREEEEKSRKKNRVEGLSSVRWQRRNGWLVEGWGWRRIERRGLFSRDEEGWKQRESLIEWKEAEKERERERNARLRQERGRGQSECGLRGCRCQATKHTPTPEGRKPDRGLISRNTVHRESYRTLEILCRLEMRVWKSVSPVDDDDDDGQQAAQRRFLSSTFLVSLPLLISYSTEIVYWFLSGTEERKGKKNSRATGLARVSWKLLWKLINEFPGTIRRGKGRESLMKICWIISWDKASLHRAYNW